MDDLVVESKGKILFIFPKWPEATLWGHFRYKFPPLGLLTIAGVTPCEFEVSFIDENVEDVDFSTDADIVAFSVMTPLAHRAYEIGDRFRALKKTVVMGGVHVSCFPDEACEHADAVVLGEGETSWLDLLHDWETGRLKKVYQSGTLFDLSCVKTARRDLLAKGRYVTKSTIQLIRGCPHDCEFCSVTAHFGRKFRFRPLSAFIEEFQSLDDRFVFIVDDNIVSNKKTAKELFARLKGSGKWWGSQVPITIADDELMLKQMADSGCKSLFIGFESLRQDNLQQVGKGFVKASLHKERIRKIQDHGIGILGSFIVGLDYDDASTFDELYSFITKTRLEAFLISVLTPFPGTKLTARLLDEGRVLTKDWSRYDMSTVVYQPKNFTPEELQERYNALNISLYTVSSIFRRTIKPRKNMLIFVPQNFGFREAWNRLAAYSKSISPE